MASKAKKRPSAAKPAATKQSNTAPKDTKALNREIVETLFTDEERAGMFLAGHWKKLIALAAIAVVAITVGFAVYKHREATRQKAAIRLAKAATVADLEAALAEAPAIPGVDTARFRLAKLYADRKEFDKARLTLRTIVDRTEDSAVRDRAKLERAYLLELDPKAKKEDAAKEFEVIAASADGRVAARAEAAYAAARLYIESKHPDKAKLVLDKITAQLNASGTGQSAAYWKNRLTHLRCTLN